MTLSPRDNSGILGAMISMTCDPKMLRLSFLDEANKLTHQLIYHPQVSTQLEKENPLPDNQDAI